jgi:hypothetical protein
MNYKRIALVRYTPGYFWSFGQALEQTGFEVYWINAMYSDARYLLDHGVSSERVLDTTWFEPSAYDLAECRRRLAKLEISDGPRIHDIILMDRILRNKPQEFAIKYLGHMEQIISAFLTDNNIAMVTSGRDTALQLLTMLVCRRLSIPWVVPTRARIPQEMYGFCQRHDTEDLIRLREVTSDDRAWARDFLRAFETKVLKPALKTSARGFGDVLRLLPLHARVFMNELKKSFKDHGNDYACYPIPSLIQMYLRRRINLLRYILSPPYSAPGNMPFCLYALHTQPESSIDVVGSYFSDQLALITFIARSLPISHELYVKVHPTDVDGKNPSFYRQIVSIPGVRLIGHGVDSHDLLKRTSLVFALSGTIAYEAGLMGKPVVTFARNYFNTLPTLHFCDAPPRLPSLINALLDTAPPSNWRRKVVDFLSELKASCFEGEVNRTYGASISSLSSQDLSTLQQAYNSLYNLLVEGRNN